MSIKKLKYEFYTKVPKVIYLPKNEVYYNKNYFSEIYIDIEFLLKSFYDLENFETLKYGYIC